MIRKVFDFINDMYLSTAQRINPNLQMFDHKALNLVRLGGLNIQKDRDVLELVLPLFSCLHLAQVFSPRDQLLKILLKLNNFLGIYVILMVYYKSELRLQFHNNLPSGLAPLKTSLKFFLSICGRERI